MAHHSLLQPIQLEHALAGMQQRDHNLLSPYSFSIRLPVLANPSPVDLLSSAASLTAIL